MIRAIRFVFALALLSGCATGGGDELWRHRNLGRAYYEREATAREAVEEFRQALALAPDSPRERVNYALALIRAGRDDEGAAELTRVQRTDPSIPHTWFNLGLLYKKRGDAPQAIAQFEGMARLVDTDAITHFNLGYLYARAGKTPQAIAELSRAAELDRHFAAPHYQLFTIYRAGGPEQEALAAREQTLFEEARYRRTQMAVAESVDWGPYAELIDELPPPRARASRVNATPAFREQIPDVPAAGPGPVGLVVADVNGHGQPDLIEWSDAGVTILDRGRTRMAISGLESAGSVQALAAGDFDNDGLVDLCVITRDAARLYRNRGSSFEAVTSASLAGTYSNAVWVDYDHDYDLDLLLLGERTRLIRNNGAAGFADVSDRLPLQPGRSLDAVVFDVDPDAPGHDILVSYQDHDAVLYRDRLAGIFEAQPFPAIAAGATRLHARDLNGDGRTDVAAGMPVSTIALNRPNGFDAAPVPGDGTVLAPVDLVNAGVAALVTGTIDVRRAAGGLAKWTASNVRAAAAADFDGDRRVDLAMVTPDGGLHVLLNDSRAGGAIRIRLEGMRNLKTAIQARVEIRAGAFYEKQTYRGVPLVFGLGAAARVDSVRITWPNGLIQSESKPDSLDVTYKEARRLSGSCPMIFTWNGRGFEFITDVLGVAPLGASSGDGEVFPVDHDEYVHVPGSALVPRDGSLEVRITEELHEVSYLDQVRLFAVDHPSGVTLVSNEKFKGPPFPEFRLFDAAGGVHPVTARSGDGRDVRERLLRRDHRYPDGFARDYAGVAELHDLILDFGGAAPDNRAVLILNGWVDWADGSTFKAASQERPQGLTMPSLAVKDASGEWRTVIDDMGFPAGKPKTIAVDLTGLFLSRSREIRIRTDLCIYWDEILLAPSSDAPRAVMSPIDLVGADLRFRGFSRAVIDPSGRRPESFVYTERAERIPPAWNQVSGLYTRYGDVTPLMRDADDRMAILGSGDELRLRYAASSVPPLRPGWVREYFLLVDGWAKDADPNTAFSQSVEPLPFHGMSAYPYGRGEHYPDDPVHDEYRKTYNTRPALRLLAPMTRAPRSVP